MSLLVRSGITQHAGRVRLRTVFAYDVSSPRRAYRVRRVLESWRIDAQYSVVEAFVTPRERLEIAHELNTYMDPKRDSLIALLPARKHRLCGDRLVEAALDGTLHDQPAGMLPARNYLLCYDIRDNARLAVVHATVAAMALYLQRSAYWFRGSLDELAGLTGAIARALSADDLFWVFPFRAARDLWFIVGGMPAVLTAASPAWQLRLFGANPWVE